MGQIWHLKNFYCANSLGTGGGRRIQHNSTMAFLVTALASVPGLVMFQLFGTDQIQEWALVWPLLPKFEKSSKLKNEDSSSN